MTTPGDGPVALAPAETAHALTAAQGAADEVSRLIAEAEQVEDEGWTRDQDERALAAWRTAALASRNLATWVLLADHSLAVLRSALAQAEAESRKLADTVIALRRDLDQS